MTEPFRIDYHPEPSGFNDTLLAFQVFAGPRISALIEPDPLGPINKLVTLMVGERRIRTTLCHVPPGAQVRVVRDEGAWTLGNLFAFRDRLWDSRGSAEPEPAIDIQPPGWRIEINGRTVLTVTDAKMAPPRPPAPRVPLWRRMRRAMREQLRADADWIAGRLGYHRDDECSGGDW